MSDTADLYLSRSGQEQVVMVPLSVSAGLEVVFHENERNYRSAPLSPGNNKKKKKKKLLEISTRPHRPHLAPIRTFYPTQDESEPHCSSLLLTLTDRLSAICIERPVENKKDVMISSRKEPNTDVENQKTNLLMVILTQF